MIIKRVLLQAAALVATRGMKVGLPHGAVQVYPDGMVEATDGHMAIQVRDQYPHLEEDWPTKGLPELGPLTQPAVIPVDIVDRLIKGTAKKSPIPILSAVRVGHNGEAPIACATDLQDPVVADLGPSQEEFRVPKIANVLIPADRPAIQVTFAADLLEQLVRLAKLTSRAKSEQAIRFYVPSEAEYHSNGEVVHGVRFTCGQDGIDVEGVVMPCRL